VGRPHGLDGSFTVRDARAGLLELGARVLIADSERRIVRRAGLDSAPIVRLEGCSDRDAAAALVGAELHVSLASAPPLGEDEWYAEELEGCAVVDGERAVGSVRRLLALPSCEVLEVARPGEADLLVPLVRDAVRSVDIDARMVDVDLMFLGEGVVGGTGG
jgi:16S rRNA processing protein RimM